MRIHGHVKVTMKNNSNEDVLFLEKTCENFLKEFQEKPIQSIFSFSATFLAIATTWIYFYHVGRLRYLVYYGMREFLFFGGPFAYINVAEQDDFIPLIAILFVIVCLLVAFFYIHRQASYSIKRCRQQGTKPDWKDVIARWLFPFYSAIVFFVFFMNQNWNCILSAIMSIALCIILFYIVIPPFGKSTPHLKSKKTDIALMFFSFIIYFLLVGSIFAWSAGNIVAQSATEFPIINTANWNEEHWKSKGLTQTHAKLIVIYECRDYVVAAPDISPASFTIKLENNGLEIIRKEN